MQALFDKISVSGLTNQVLDKVEEVRPGVSRNTVHLALKDERNEEELTPLRKYIREVAENILIQGVEEK
jgi:hypothetical protein